MKKPRTKKKLESALRVNVYRVLSDAVDRGVLMGIRRAHKHTDKPDEDTLAERIHDEVMLVISEHFEFDDGAWW